MLHLTKNSRNMCCALAVAAVFFIIVKSMQSEGFRLKRINGFRFNKRENIDRDENVNNVKTCKRKCRKDPDCAGFVHHTDTKICNYKSKQQIPFTERSDSNIYIKQ